MHKNSPDLSVYYAALGVIEIDTIAVVLILRNFDLNNLHIYSLLWFPCLPCDFHLVEISFSSSDKGEYSNFHEHWLQVNQESGV